MPDHIEKMLAAAKRVEDLCEEIWQLGSSVIRDPVILHQLESASDEVEGSFWDAINQEKDWETEGGHA